MDLTISIWVRSIHTQLILSHESADRWLILHLWPRWGNSVLLYLCDKHALLSMGPDLKIVILFLSWDIKVVILSHESADRGLILHLWPRWGNSVLLYLCDKHAFMSMGPDFKNSRTISVLRHKIRVLKYIVNSFIIAYLLVFHRKLCVSILMLCHRSYSVDSLRCVDWEGEVVVYIKLSWKNTIFPLSIQHNRYFTRSSRLILWSKGKKIKI
jgi:hypothetical protein